MRRSIRLGAMFCVVVMGGALAGCGGDTLQTCEKGQTWDGAKCRPAVSCGSGTAQNPKTLACEPVCKKQNQLWNGTTCVDIATMICGEGTMDNGSGYCVADPKTNPDPDKPDGIPVPDTLVPEQNEGDGQSNDILAGGTPTDFALAHPNQLVRLTGIIDAPVEGADWDTYAFEAQAGTYLKITAGSEQSVRPFFFVGQANAEGEFEYLRFATEPDGGLVTRYAYLPKDGVYYLSVSDSVNFDAMNNPFVSPAGGKNFAYFVDVRVVPVDPDKIQEVSKSALKTLTALPGGFEGQNLQFYRLTDLTAGDIVDLFLVTKPIEDESGRYTFNPAILLIDAAGELITEQTTDQESIRALFQAPQGSSVTVVVDYVIMNGPARGFQLVSYLPEVIDCDSKQTGANACRGAQTLPGVGMQLYRFALDGDRYLALTAQPGDKDQNLALTLYDGALKPIAQVAGEPGPKTIDTFATRASSLLVEVALMDGTASGYDLDYAIAAPQPEGTAETLYQTTPMPAGYLGLAQSSLGIHALDVTESMAGEDKLLFFLPMTAAGAQTNLMIQDTDLGQKNLLAICDDQGCQGANVPFARLLSRDRTLSTLLIAGEGAQPYQASVLLTTMTKLPVVEERQEAKELSVDPALGGAFLTFQGKKGEAYEITLTPKDEADPGFGLIVMAFFELEEDQLVPGAGGRYFLLQGSAEASPEKANQASTAVKAEYDGAQLIYVQYVGQSPTPGAFDLTVEPLTAANAGSNPPANP